MSETEPEKKSTPTPTKRSHHKKVTPAPPPPADPPKKGREGPREKHKGWVPRSACGTLLVPKELIEANKREAREKGMYLWELAQRKMERPL